MQCPGVITGDSEPDFEESLIALEKSINSTKWKDRDCVEINFLKIVWRFRSDLSPQELYLVKSRI